MTHSLRFIPATLLGTLAFTAIACTSEGASVPGAPVVSDTEMSPGSNTGEDPTSSGQSTVGVNPPTTAKPIGTNNVAASNSAGSPSSKPSNIPTVIVTSGAVPDGGIGSQPSTTSSAPIGNPSSQATTSPTQTAYPSATTVTSATPSAAPSAAPSATLNNPLNAPVSYINNCAVCHGVDAKGVDLLGPEVEHANRELMNYYVRNGDNNMWNGCTGTAEKSCSTWGSQEIMTKFTPAEVSDADLGAIQTWLQGLPQPTAGAALYADYCSYCHGDRPSQLVALTHYAKNATLIVTPATKADFVKVVKDGLISATRGQDGRDAYMPGLASQLNDAAIEKIRQFICTDFGKTDGLCQ